jgi:signal peptidase I
MRVMMYLFVAFLITLPVHFFVAEPFIVSGLSMSPTFVPGDYLIIDKLHYNVTPPLRGEIAIFHFPLDSSLFYIKRIIGLPGETIAITRGVVAIVAKDGHRTILKAPYLSAQAFDKEVSTTTLAADEYFVMGDNRAASSDSRDWGPLQKKFLIGPPVARLWPLHTAGMYPGIYRGQ